MCVFLSALFCDGCSVINTGYDDLLHYSYRRVPDWYDLELSAKFKDGYSLWYYLSLAKIVCCGLSWMLVSFELRPSTYAFLSKEVRAVASEARALAGSDDEEDEDGE